MKKYLLRPILALSACLIVVSSFAISSSSSVLPADKKISNTWTSEFSDVTELNTLNPDMLRSSLDEFLSLTPAKYKELTGKRLGLKKSIELKVAQKMLKKKMGKAEGGISKGLYIVLAILGFGWLAMGIMDDWSGNNWWVNLILTLLFWLPGLIHALIVMKDYYN
jgi:uncharacterized membrane protein YqaE (UPF0057 family)